MTGLRLSIPVLVVALNSSHGAHASSGDAGGSNSHPTSNNLGGPSLPFFFSEISTFEMSSSPPENDDCSKQCSDTEEEMSDSSASVVSSSLLYDGGCFVSSQAMMCYGGDAYDVIPEFDFSEEALHDSDDDDDENDDDDGHSSMLSNTSLSRSRKLTVGPASSSRSFRELSMTSESPAAAVTLHAKSNSMYYTRLITSPRGASFLSGRGAACVPWGVVQLDLKDRVFGLADALASNELVPHSSETGRYPWN
jgi:hypothetical protein